jgi:acyl dehydratase
VAARAVFDKFHPEDALKLKTINGKFTAHVFPGETMIVDMWKEDNVIIFDARTKEREGKTVVKGYCELHE